MDQKRRTNVFIGSAIERVEDLRLLRGRGQFVDDLDRQNLLHAVILRSAVAHGRIRSIDTAAARELPGVHAVITAAEIGAPVPTIPLRQDSSPEFKPFEQPAVATSAAARSDRSLLFEAAGTNCALTLSGVRGDADSAFKDAAFVRREKFAVQRHGAVPMEPRGLLAEWDAACGELTIYGAAKVACLNRRILAKQMDMAERAIRMVENDVGGGFGARGEFYPEDFLIPFAARFSGRPVKWTEDRRENLMATQHARDADCDIEIACARDGTILGLRGEVWCDVGAYIRTNGLVAPRNVVQFMSGPYRIPNIS